MDRFSFTLHVSGIDTDGDGYADRLYEGGCDDALVAVINGQLQIDFDREASSYGAAVDSAVNDIARAGGKLVRVEEIPA